MKVSKKIKSVLLFFSLFFTLGVFAQITVAENLEPYSYRLVNFKDTLYLIQKKGYYKITENYIAYFDFKYVAEQVKDQPPSFFNFSAIKDTLYGVHPGGGILYQFKKDSILRIDDSRMHRNQYGSNIFTHKDTLYNLGGYGLWNSKATLTYYDFNDHQWHVIPTKGEIPKYGFSAGRHTIIGSTIHILGAHYTDPNTQRQENIGELLRLDLDTKTWLSPIKLNEIIFNAIYNRTLNAIDNLICYKDKMILLPVSSDPFYYEFDFKNLKFLRTKFSEDFLMDAFAPMMYKDYLLRYTREVTSNELTLDLVVLPRDLQPASWMDIEKQETSQNLILVGVVILFAVLLIIYKYNQITKRVRLLKRRVYYLGKSIPITSSEYFFLNILFSTGRVDNKTLLSYFYKEDVTQDMIIKRKNAMVENLTGRIKQYFKTEFFTKAPDPNDKRQVIYILKKGLVLRSIE